MAQNSKQGGKSTGGANAGAKKNASGPRSSPVNKSAAAKGGASKPAAKPASKPAAKQNAKPASRSPKTSPPKPGSRSDLPKAVKAHAEEMKREEEQVRQQKNVLSLVLFALAVVFLLLIVFPNISLPISGFLFGLFGICSWAWCAALFLLSFYISHEDDMERVGSVISMTFLFLLVLSAFVHCISNFSADIIGSTFNDIVYELYHQGKDRHGAGLIGGALGALMVSLLGRVLSIVVIILAAFIVVMLMTRTSLSDLWHMFTGSVTNMRDRASEFAGEMAQARAERISEREAEEQEDRRRESERRRLFDLPPELDDDINSPTPKQVRSRRSYRAEDIDIPLDDDTPIDSRYGIPDDDEVLDYDDEPEEAAETEEEPKKKSKRRSSAKYDPDSGALSEIPDFIADPDADVTDEQIEDIYMAAVNRTRQQREEELAQEAVEFAQEVEQQDDDEPVEYTFPSCALLTKPVIDEDDDMLEEFQRNGVRLEEVLKEYGVAAKVVDICRGPAVTRYELEPGHGVRITKITGLTKDIALRLAAKAVRIEAPIPGKAAVGIEIPNATPSTVCERSLIETTTFYEAPSPVTVAIGKDIDGNNIFCDISKMPHLLIAGSTGTGKSVCINSMLISLLYKSSPEDVRLIMVDPKAVELDVYNGIPHLLVPVVCDPKKAAGALQWAVGEMEKRYALLKEYGVRNIDGYNKLAENDPEIRHMPRILIVIDEMADLMATSPKEVETAIARLAAMARAAGMHMILATQRPSVDVITGTIKNNIPSRIAFAVSSQIDSRTILDESGAEGLIGRGDMLFKPIGKKPIRVQGCFVSDEEVNDVVSFIKETSTADYDEDIAREIERNAAGAEGGSGDDGFDAEEDELFLDAVEAVLEQGQASTSMLQRRLGVGYARAGRMIDQLCDHGIIGPFKGSKPRDVLITRQEFLEMKLARERPAAPAAPEPAPARPAVSGHAAHHAPQEVKPEPWQQERLPDALASSFIDDDDDDDDDDGDVLDELIEFDRMMSGAGSQDSADDDDDDEYIDDEDGDYDDDDIFDEPPF